MELSYKGTFFRDLDNIDNRYVRFAVRKKIAEAGKAKNLNQIQNLKKLRMYETRYRIEIKISEYKIYWILCTIVANKIKFLL